MDTLRYCFDENFALVVFNTEGKHISWEGILTTAKDNVNMVIKLCSYKNREYGHICNTKKFNCNRPNCKHFISGEISIMIVEKIISLRKSCLILLNEPFVDFETENESLRNQSFISYNKQYIPSKSWHIDAILLCKTCNKRFDIARDEVKIII